MYILYSQVPLKPPSLPPQRSILWLLWKLGLYYEIDSYQSIYNIPENVILFLKSYTPCQANEDTRNDQNSFKSKGKGRVKSQTIVMSQREIFTPPQTEYRALYHSISLKSINLQGDKIHICKFKALNFSWFLMEICLFQLIKVIYVK